MTTFGWDTSRYDGTLTRTVLATAKAEGIEFWTHKLGEGLSEIDPQAKAAFAAARSVFAVIGGYWFIHGNDDPAAEAARCVAVAGEVAPYWRDFDGWFWQTDAETSSTGLPAPSYVKAFSDHLANASGKTVMVYASAGMYGNRLVGLGHPLWNAHYGSDATGPFKALYPGDNSAGWNAYSGQVPTLLQYSSNATIAGRTTCDANAFRGTIDDLLALIGAPMAHDPIDDADALKIAREVWNLMLGSSGPSAGLTLEQAATAAQVKAISDKLDALIAKLPVGISGAVHVEGDLTVTEAAPGA